jgi:putative ubiquitin-RnfH superfamily antitoxin RatB of RatAB toxin-antitoxin module
LRKLNSPNPNLADIHCGKDFVLLYRFSESQEDVEFDVCQVGVLFRITKSKQELEDRRSLL